MIVVINFISNVDKLFGEIYISYCEVVVRYKSQSKVIMNNNEWKKQIKVHIDQSGCILNYSTV